MSAPAIERSGAHAAPAPSQELQDEALGVAGVDEVDITGHPPLRPVGTFRMRQRVDLFKAVQSLASRLNARADEQDAAADDAEQDVDLGQLDLLAEVDELLEHSCVVDPAAYATWATVDGGGPDVEARVMALFSKVADDLGKSMGSAS